MSLELPFLPHMNSCSLCVLACAQGVHTGQRRDGAKKSFGSDLYLRMYGCMPIHVH